MNPARKFLSPPWWLHSLGLKNWRQIVNSNSCNSCNSVTKFNLNIYFSNLTSVSQVNLLYASPIWRNEVESSEVCRRSVEMPICRGGWTPTAGCAKRGKEPPWACRGVGMLECRNDDSAKFLPCRSRWLSWVRHSECGQTWRNSELSGAPISWVCRVETSLSWFNSC